MTIAITLVAAMLAGTGFVLQQHAAEQAPKSYFLRLRLITTLLHRPRWLAGVAVMAVGQLVSAWAIGHVALSLAEPLLTSSLIFALALAVPLSGQRLRTAEILGAVLLSVGVAALSVARSAGPPTERSARLPPGLPPQGSPWSPPVSSWRGCAAGGRSEPS